MNNTNVYVNETVSVAYINAIMSLISLMSSHFLVNSFTVLSDSDTNFSITFLKAASKFNVEISFTKSLKNNILTDNNGYLIIGKPKFSFSKFFKAKPKVVIAVNFKNEKYKYISNIVIPSSISFFVVHLSGNLLNSGNEPVEIWGECFRFYRPMSIYSLKTFPMLKYKETNGTRWTWVNPSTNWNSFDIKIRNMSGVTITVALASHKEKRIMVQNFWNGRNSFFWKAMQDHLRFRCLIHFQSISPQAVRSITNIYLALLTTVADGLGVLPVISSERNLHLGFLVTGVDSKYHLYVRTPQYIHSWQSVFKPLAFESWLSLGFTILLTAITLKIVTFCQNISIDSANCLLTVLGFVCCQGSAHIPKSLSARLVCYTALIFSILIYQFYTSNFYSLLSTKEVRLPFTSLEQFINKKSHALFVHPDTAIYGDLVKAKNGTFKKLWDEFLKNDPLHQLKAHLTTSALDKVCKGKGAILGLPFQTLHLSSAQCKLVPVNSGFFPSKVVTVVRKNFPFMSQFKFVHLRLLESGLSHKFRDDNLNYDQHYETKPDVTNDSVSLEHVAFLFAFHAVFVLISLILLGLEIMAAKTYTSIIKKKHLRLNFCF